MASHSGTALPAEAAPADKSMAEMENDFGYHPVGTTPATLEDVRPRAHMLFSLGL